MMMRRAALLLAFGFGGVVPACSTTTLVTQRDADASADGASADTDDASADDASVGPQDAGADASTEPLACSHTLTAPFVTVTYVNTLNLTKATGGTVADGHYLLESQTTNASHFFDRLRSELWFSKGRYEYPTVRDDGSGETYGGRFTSSGTSLEMKVDCGGQTGPLVWQYSVSGSALQLQVTNINGFSFLLVFRRAP